MKKGPLFLTLGLLCSLLVSGYWMYQPMNSDHVSELGNSLSTPMTQAAQDLIETFTEEQKELALFPFESQERSNWHFTPVRRKGLMWEQMSSDQRQKLTALLRTTLSESGYEKIEEIRGLELVLREVESRGSHDRYRHPDRYFLSIFGTPEGSEPWGWRFEGHHLSTNFSSVTGKIAVTPIFWGANPGEVRVGEHTGKRVLKAEEDLARTLVQMLDNEQLKMAQIADDAPDEIFSFEDPYVHMDTYEGLPVSKFTEAQKLAFLQLLRIYLDNMNTELADRYYAEIEAAGWDQTYFTWMGSLEPGKRHYYRIHSPAILVEYDNTQNDANHIHLVWRDPANDFGRDLLKQHYKNSPHHQK